MIPVIKKISCLNSKKGSLNERTETNRLGENGKMEISEAKELALEIKKFYQKMEQFERETKDLENELKSFFDDLVRDYKLEVSLDE